MLDFGFYNMDCMEGMKEFPDKYFDLAIVDPPYGININNNIGRRKGDKPSSYPKAYWDGKPPEKSYFDELFRISKKQVIWGGELFCPTTLQMFFSMEETTNKRGCQLFNV